MIVSHESAHMEPTFRRDFDAVPSPHRPSSSFPGGSHHRVVESRVSTLDGPRLLCLNRFHGNGFLAPRSTEGNPRLRHGSDGQEGGATTTGDAPASPSTAPSPSASVAKTPPVLGILCFQLPIIDGVSAPRALSTLRARPWPPSPPPPPPPPRRSDAARRHYRNAVEGPAGGRCFLLGAPRGLCARSRRKRSVPVWGGSGPSRGGGGCRKGVSGVGGAPNAPTSRFEAAAAARSAGMGGHCATASLPPSPPPRPLTP